MVLVPVRGLRRGAWLWRVHPTLCRAIRERHQAYAAPEVAVRRSALAAKVRETVRSLTEQGIYPSSHQVGMATGLMLLQRDLGDAWRDEAIASGWGEPSRVRRVTGRPVPVPLCPAR